MKDRDEPLFIRLPISIDVEELDASMNEAGFAIQKRNDQYVIVRIPEFIRRVKDERNQYV
jgi:hypothetical protein